MECESTDNDCKDNNREYNGENDEQAATLVTGCLLISCCLSVFDVRLPGIGMYVLDIVGNRRQLLALLVHNLRNLTEQHVEIPYALLNVSDLLLAFDDQGFLEVDLVLGRHLRLCEFLSLELLEGRARR